MKATTLVIALVTTLIFNSAVYGKGKYEIVVTQIDDSAFSVALINSYSNYYNQMIQGVFDTRNTAEQAGKNALEKFLNSGADIEPEICSYGITWM